MRFAPDKVARAVASFKRVVSISVILPLYFWELEETVLLVPYGSVTTAFRTAQRSATGLR
jgi:hypothetical protein